MAHCSNYTDPSWAARRQGGTLLIGLFGGPIGLTIETFMNGFFYYGFTLSGEPTTNCHR